MEETGITDSFKVMGRGELQLAILIEMMRREGFELVVGKPEIVTKRIDGKLMEPVEQLTIDVPEGFVGVVIEKLGARKGEDAQDAQPRLRPRAHGVPRAQPRADRPAQRDAHRHARHHRDEFAVRRLHRVAGRDSASRPRARWSPTAPALTTAYALWGLQERGELFVGPGVEVYEGMIVGENSRDNDLDVNVVREKKLTNMRASTADEAIRLVPLQHAESGAGHRVHRRR